MDRIRVMRVLKLENTTEIYAEIGKNFLIRSLN